MVFIYLDYCKQGFDIRVIVGGVYFFEIKSRLYGQGNLGKEFEVGVGNDFIVFIEIKFVFIYIEESQKRKKKGKFGNIFMKYCILDFFVLYKKYL